MGEIFEVGGSWCWEIHLASNSLLLQPCSKPHKRTWMISWKNHRCREFSTGLLQVHSFFGKKSHEKKKNGVQLVNTPWARITYFCGKTLLKGAAWMFMAAPFPTRGQPWPRWWCLPSRQNLPPKKAWAFSVEMICAHSLEVIRRWIFARFVRFFFWTNHWEFDFCSRKASAVFGETWSILILQSPFFLLAPILQHCRGDDLRHLKTRMGIGVWVNVRKTSLTQMFLKWVCFKTGWCSDVLA